MSWGSVARSNPDPAPDWRSRTATAVMAALLVLASTACVVSTSAPSPTATPKPPAVTTLPSDTLPKPVIDVTTLGGCRGDGKTDCTAAVQEAVRKLDAAHAGTVYLPAGRFLVNGAVAIETGAPIYIAGASRDQSTLIEGGGSELLKVHTDGVVVQDLTLDTQTNHGRACIVVVANHTTLRRARIVGGDRAFALYYAGPKGATPYKPQYNVGNQVLDTSINDLIKDDGFSWSFQQSGIIRNIEHTGSRLAIYVDRDVLVDGYHYAPGPQAPHATDGFYITPPSDRITIQNFVSTGSGGVIGSDHPTKFGSEPRVSTNITIAGEKVMNAGNRLSVGDVRSLTLRDCSFAGADRIVVKPTHVLQQMRVENCTVPSVQFAVKNGTQVSDVVFANDTFPAFKPEPGQDGHTFVQSGDERVAFTVQGGTFSNASGGLSAGSLTPQVSALAGYQ